ncbi:MAG TPA: hypothetical protein VFX41_04275 [Actinomycetales bacterium]|jgi:hypothetical protein|nr:hypothetical protein [Actinomycetales bacterium]
MAAISESPQATTETRDTDEQVTDSTVADVRQRALSPWRRRVPAILLGLFVVAGAVGLLGVRSTTATSEENGYRLTLDYASVTRTGQDSMWRLRVDADEPLSDDIVVRVTADYFDIWEHQGWYPEPSDVQRDGRFLYLTFAPPPSGNTFVVDLDAYIQPASQIGRSAQVALMVDGRPTAPIDFTTRVLP